MGRKKIGKIIRQCVVCENDFEWITGKMFAYKRTCSRDCQLKLLNVLRKKRMVKKIHFVCKNCGKIKEIPHWEKYKKFCSKECARKYNSGKNHWYWRGGITSERAQFDTSKDWKEARKIIWKLDDATCQKCKRRFNNHEQPFEVHHKKSFANREFRTAVENLILVCNKCHKWIHSKKNIGKEFIED